MWANSFYGAVEYFRGLIGMPSQITSSELAHKISLLESISGTFVHRSGTSAEIGAIVLANGELAFVTDLNEIRRGDGSTPGGVSVSAAQPWTHYANVTTSTAGSGYINVISAPVAAGSAWEFKVFVKIGNSVARTVSSLVWSDETLELGHYPSNLLGYGPTLRVSVRRTYSLTGAADELRSYHSWNLITPLQMVPSTEFTESGDLGVLAGNQYHGAEYEGWFHNASSERNLILRVKTPDGPATSLAIQSHMMLRKLL